MEIDDRVQQEIEDGQLVGPGCFTISLEKMLEKLTSFREKEPLGWLGRIVQAAVASQANRLEIKRGHEFDFEPAQPLSLVELERILLNPQEVVCAWLEHLRCALWCLGWVDQGGFTVQLRGEPQQLTCRRGKFAHQPAQSLETFFRAEPGEEPAEEHWRKMLEFYAHCCPIPVLLGTRRLDVLESACEAPLASGCCRAQDFPKLQMPSGSTGAPKGPYRLLKPDLRAGSVLWSLGRGGVSALRWVDNGVVVDTEELFPNFPDMPPHILAYASAEGLPGTFLAFNCWMGRSGISVS